MSMETIIEKAITACMPVFIGGSGGVVALILKNQKPTIGTLLAAVCVSGFAGFLMSKLCTAVGMNQDFSSVAIGVAGLFGPKVLQAMGTHVFDKVGLKVDITPQKHSIEVPLPDKQATDVGKS